MWPKRPASVVIDSATYLLTISLPDIDNIAMSLYNIKHVRLCIALILPISVAFASKYLHKIAT